MLLDQVSDTEMRTASVLTGATMAAFLAASRVGRYAGAIRLAVAVAYVAGVGVFVLYCLL